MAEKNDGGPAMCQSAGCKAMAEHSVFWPGRAPIHMCGYHRDGAAKISDAMGFHLHTEPFSPNGSASDG